MVINFSGFLSGWKHSNLNSRQSTRSSETFAPKEGKRTRSNREYYAGPKLTSDDVLRSERGAGVNLGQYQNQLSLPYK